MLSAFKDNRPRLPGRPNHRSARKDERSELLKLLWSTKLGPLHRSRFGGVVKEYIGPAWNSPDTAAICFPRQAARRLVRLSTTLRRATKMLRMTGCSSGCRIQCRWACRRHKRACDSRAILKGNPLEPGE